MNRRFLIGITIIVVGIAAIIISQGGSLTTLADAASTTPIVPGEVSIKLKPGFTAADRASLSHAHGALGIKNDWSAFGWLNLNVPPGQEQAIADQFRADPRVVEVDLVPYGSPAGSTQPSSGPPSSQVPHIPEKSCLNGTFVPNQSYPCPSPSPSSSPMPSMSIPEYRCPDGTLAANQSYCPSPSPVAGSPPGGSETAPRSSTGNGAGSLPNLPMIAPQTGHPTG